MSNNSMPILPHYLRPGQKPSAGQELISDRIKFLRIAKVTRVDNIKGRVDLQWMDNFGEQVNVPLPSAYASQRGTIQAMPEVNSLCVCGWIRQTQTLENPIVLGFLDVNLQNELSYRLSRSSKTPDTLKEIKTIREKIGYESVRTKRKKIYSGEIQIESAQGAELYLHDDVYLSNKALNEIEIVSADQSIRLSSRQEYHSTSGTRSWDGLVVREPVKGEQIFQPTSLSNGQLIQVVTESNNPFHLGGKAFTEHRVEIYEKSSGGLNITEVNSGYDVSALTPYITSVLGTLVGNDKSDVQHYSKVLRPQIFGTPDDSSGKADLIECLPEEYNTLAGACLLSFNKSRAYIAIDKQGHLFTNFPASTGQHPQGAGRSWEANFEGSVKWVIGANTATNRSLILDTKGGIKESLGYDSLNQRSKETIAQKSIYTEVLAADANGDAFVVKTVGNVRYNVSGNYFIDVAGDYTITVSGKIQENIMGTKTENYINDKNTVYGGNYKEIVMKRKEESIGTARKVSINGVESEVGKPPITKDDPVDELSITIGSRKETYTLGNLNRSLLLGDMTSELTAGNIDDKITLGDRKLTITTGNSKEDVTTGDIQETVLTGNIKETVTTGDVQETVTTGNIKEDVTTGDIQETVLTGNIKQTVTTGNIEDTVTLGSIKETITTGNKEVAITAGNYQVNVTAGNIEIKTAAGTVNVQTQTATVDIQGLLQVTVKSGVKLVLDGPLVDIGALPTKGGVITGLPGVPTHLDYITGLPLVGSKTVNSAI